MSNIGLKDPYPNEAFLVDSIHYQPLKDVVEAALSSHDWFGFGSQHQAGDLDNLTTTDLTEGANLYFTEARVATYIEGSILEYGYEAVTASTTVTKTKTVFSGSTANQTLTLPTVGTSGREVEVFNSGTVVVSLSGSSVLSELYPNESACFIDTGSDWIA